MLKEKISFLLILVISLFITSDVFASTSSGYASTDFSLYYIDNTSHGTKCSTKINYNDFSTDNSGSWSGWTDIDNTLGSYNDLAGVGSLIGRVSFRVYGSSTYIYKTGNSYTVRLTIDFDNSINADNFIKYYKLQYYRGNTSASQNGNTVEVFDSISSRMSKGSEDYRVLIYITFTPNQDLKFLRFDFVQKNLSLTDKTQYVNECDLLISSIEYEYLKITYVEGSNALIQEQTAMIEEKFNNFMSIFQKNNDETLNADADSSFSGNSDNFDNYNESENELINSVDVDISNFRFDVDNYRFSFDFVWTNLTNFINSNIKILNMIIGALTLSFVGLVIGRL